MRCYIFDLDGTLCDITHRLHYIKPGRAPAVTGPATMDVMLAPDWHSFYAACVGDVPIGPICQLVRTLHNAQNEIVFVTGRSNLVRSQTRAWLQHNVLPSLSRTHLFMRNDGDHRQDHIVKGEILDMMLARGFRPIMAFEDRKQVVDMWRSRGIVCAQVAEGDF